MKLFMKRCKPVTYLILFFACWQFLQLYNYAYAFKGTRQDMAKGRMLESRLANNTLEQKLKRTQVLFKVLAGKLEQDGEVKNEIKRLKSFRKELKKENDEVLEYFASVRKRLIDKNLPQVILDRHDRTVEEYQEKFGDLQKKLERVSKAKGNNLKAAVAEAANILDKSIHKKKHLPLDPNKLPHRMPKIKERKPRTTLKEYLKDREEQLTVDSQQFTDEEKSKQSMDRERGLDIRMGAIPPPGPDDLAETVEVKFTQSIQDLAAELEHHPLKIYNWVRNNIEFVPTYGSIQGAEMCLMTKQGNAFDTSSLLIALLRTSNIPARYVYGTVEIPIDKAMNWVGGVTDPIVAGKILASGGIPTDLVHRGGMVDSVQIEHVWVEAYVDYVPYRGAVKGPGDTWIPLDASFKQYSFTEGIDTDAVLPLDVDALLTEAKEQSVIDEAIPSITSLPENAIQNQLLDYRTRLDNYLNDNYPEVTNYYDLSEVLHGYKRIIKKELRFLPNTLVNLQLLAKLDTFAEIPDSFRYKLRFTLDEMDYISPSACLAGKRITISYKPATSADAQVMSEAEGILDLPLYLVNVFPELRVEGQIVASGLPVKMGTNQSIEIDFDIPSRPIDKIVNTIKAGEYYAIGLSLQINPIAYVYDRVNNWEPETAEERDDRLGELLHLVSMLYHSKLEMFMSKLAQTSDITYLRFPAECMVGLSFEATSVLGVPTSVASVGMNIDVDRDIISPFSKVGNEDSQIKFMLQKGIYSSSLEHFIFEQFLGLDSISAVKFMDLASEQGIPIYILDEENSERVDELQLSFNTRGNITDLINANYMVMVPEREITCFDYTGIGYIAVDTSTGAAGYMISGGLAGGGTVRENIEEILGLCEELLDNPYDSSIGTFERWKSNMIDLIDGYPEIADQPNQEFNAWTKHAVYYGEMCTDIKYEKIKAIAGFMIIYFTYINLIVLVA